MIFLSILALVAAVQPAAAMLSCDRVVADKQIFDFSALKGPHSVVTTLHTPPTEQNVTYTLDLCGPLKRKGDVPKGEECPNGSWGKPPSPQPAVLFCVYCSSANDQPAR